MIYFPKKCICSLYVNNFSINFRKCLSSSLLFFVRMKLFEIPCLVFWKFTYWGYKRCLLNPVSKDLSYTLTSYPLWRRWLHKIPLSGPCNSTFPGDMIPGEGQDHNQGSVKDGFNQMIKLNDLIFYLQHDLNSKYACKAIIQLS